MATQPFYTTKPQGQGTGIGLAMVSDFVKASHGHMFIGNHAGGAYVELVMPAASQQHDVIKHTDTDNIIAYNLNDMGIIVIEDSEAILMLIKSFFESRNAKVSIFQNLSTFVEYAEITEDDAQIIISDINLPDGNGLDAIHLARKIINPNIVSIAISGALNNLNNNQDSNIKYMMKPFSLNTLESTITELLPNVYVDNNKSPGRQSR